MKAGHATCMCVHWPGRVRLPVHGFGDIFVSLAFVFACSVAVCLLGPCCLAAQSRAASPFCHRPQAEGFKRVREEIPLAPASLLPSFQEVGKKQLVIPSSRPPLNNTADTHTFSVWGQARKLPKILPFLVTTPSESPWPRARSGARCPGSTRVNFPKPVSAQVGR